VVAVQPPQFTQFSLGGDGFTLSGTGPSGASYRIFAATNVALPFSNWMPVATGIFHEGLFDYTDHEATNHVRRFYQITTP
jgi:hypothetical protein